jgi:hypothetical protein
MNERIRELVRQAGGHFSTRNLMSNPVQQRESIELWDDKIEKFAELIIQECAEQVSRTTEADSILVHFGIEPTQEKPLMYAGVPLVRVVKIGRRWRVQERTSEDTEDWTNIGPTFATSNEALDAAPELCEF